MDNTNDFFINNFSRCTLTFILNKVSVVFNNNIHTDRLIIYLPNKKDNK